MRDFLFLMHAGSRADPAAWGSYFSSLRARGRFEGGSSIGGGVCVTKAGHRLEVTGHLSGYIRVRAEDLADAEALLAGNPVYEAGGVVEIRELPTTEARVQAAGCTWRWRPALKAHFGQRRAHRSSRGPA